MQYEKCKNLRYVQLEVIVNATCGISSAISIGENMEKCNIYLL